MKRSRFPDYISLFRCHTIRSVRGALLTGEMQEICSKWSLSPEVRLQLDQVDAVFGWLLDINTENGFAYVFGGADMGFFMYICPLFKL